MKTKSPYQQLGWKRSLASFIYNRVCCKLWGHANGKRMTEGEIAAWAQGKKEGTTHSQSCKIAEMGKEIHRLNRLLEKRNRKIKRMREALDHQKQI